MIQITDKIRKDIDEGYGVPVIKKHKYKPEKDTNYEYSYDTDQPRHLPSNVMLLLYELDGEYGRVKPMGKKYVERGALSSYKGIMVSINELELYPAPNDELIVQIGGTSE